MVQELALGNADCTRLAADSWHLAKAVQPEFVKSNHDIMVYVRLLMVPDL